MCIRDSNFIFLKEHLDRLYKDAKLIDLKIHLTRKKLSEALIKTIKINKMKTDVHLRIIVSRGIKSTPYQSPKVTISKPTIIIIPEYKKPDIKAYKKNNMVGIWTLDKEKKEAKISSLGLRVSKGIIYHGLSLNVSCDLSNFYKIDPCGIKNSRVTSVKNLKNLIILLRLFVVQEFLSTKEWSKYRK